MNVTPETLAMMASEKAQLEPVFDRVRNPEDWKAPISAICEHHEMEIVRRAIVYFTATEPTFTERAGTRFLNVTASGYRRGPAGDH